MHHLLHLMDIDEYTIEDLDDLGWAALMYLSFLVYLYEEKSNVY